MGKNVPPPDAAFLELTYLSNGGYVDICAGTGHLAWEPDSLYDGMVALGRELTCAVLGTQVLCARALIAAHLPVDHEPLAGWRAAFDAATYHVPTSLAYRTRSEDSPRRGLPAKESERFSQ